MSETLQRIYEIGNNPDNMRGMSRTASGLIITRCVDRRLVDVGGAVRVPGNSLGFATVLAMRGQAHDVADGIAKTPQHGLRPGGHRNICAYDHNLPGVVGLVANEHPFVMDLYGQLAESANRQLPRAERFGVDLHVSDRAQRLAEKLRTHQPDVLIDAIELMPGSLVVTPDTPSEQAAAFVINTDPSNRVLDANIARDGQFYLDSSLKAYARNDRVPNDYAADALSISAATATLVASTHNLPIVVAAGLPGERDFMTLNPPALS
jgi:hypothetical protein